MMRIGDFARLARVSIKLLRHYDEIGLLPPHTVDRTTGYRYYSVEQLAMLDRLLVYRSIGFTLREIRRLLRTDTSPDELRQMLVERRAILSARIEADRARLCDLEDRIARIDREGRAAPYEIAIRSVDASVAVRLRRECDSYDEVTDLLGSLRSKLSTRAITGYGAIWHDCRRTSDRIDCEALVFLDMTKAATPSGLELVELPACTVASVVCDEAMQNSRVAYRAAIERAQQLGYDIAGPMRERYFSEAAPGSGLAEAQFPLTSSGFATTTS